MSELTTDTKYSIDLGKSQQKFIFSEEIRNRADEIISNTEFPTTRTEAWKYTRVAKIKNTQFLINEYNPNQFTKNDIESFKIKNLNGSIIVFVNGFFSKELSTFEKESGLELISLSENNSFLNETRIIESDKNDLFTALNSFYAQDGLGIRITKNSVIKQSIQVLFINSEEKVYSGNRNLIICEDFAKAHIVLNYVSINANSCFTNSVSEIHVGKNAHLTIDKIQQEDKSNFNVVREFVNQKRDSNFTINTITIDGSIVRNDLTIAVDGENCETNLSGAYLLKGKQHVDNHTVVDHKIANCQSNELYKGVIDDDSTAVFNGKVFVRKDAQKINAFQSNANVLLSDHANINSKPELEIYADDVKCSHGSTTGQLDEEAIFYLRARGLSEKSARALMVSAFIGDVIEKIENESVKNHVNQLIEKKFDWIINE